MMTVKNSFVLVRNIQHEGSKGVPMKIKMLRNTVAGGKAVLVGEVIEVPEQEAKYLVAIQKAEVFVEKEPAPVEPVIETAELPQVENAMKPRGKRNKE